MSNNVEKGSINSGTSTVFSANNVACNIGLLLEGKRIPLAAVQDVLRLVIDRPVSRNAQGSEELMEVLNTVKDELVRMLGETGAYMDEIRAGATKFLKVAGDNETSDVGTIAKLLAIHAGGSATLQ